MTYSSPSPLMGRGRDPLRSSGRVRGVQFRVDQLEHTRSVLDHVIVPEAQNTIAFAPEVGVAPAVGLLIRVLTAVCFNNQRPLETGEIDNVRRDDVLALELERGHSTVAEHGPQPPLGWRGVGAHFAGPVPEFARAPALVVRG